VVSPELARSLCELSRETGRQIGVLIDRRGRVQDVFVGDSRQIEISGLGRVRAGSRFRGLRFVHVHLGNEPLTQDDLTDLALLRFDAMVAIEALPNGLPGPVHLAYLTPGADGAAPFRCEDVPSVHALDLPFLDFIEALEEEHARLAPAGRAGGSQRRRALLVGVTTGRLEELEQSMVELQELARTAGIEVADVITQRRPSLDPRYVVGSGKMKELLIQSMQKGADLIIFEGELSGSQMRAISEMAEVEVIDRTQLILDIFARRAHSRDGKLQVELAQLKYSLPRLVLRDDFLSRLAARGGVGSGARGPGETKIEELRRRVTRRIARLEKEIEDLSRQRKVKRRHRQEIGLPVVSIVGYTNAGKSTLLNTLTGSQVLVEDRLFATLDPTSRRLRLPSGREVLLTDTVGFIQELPEDLVAAFRATLEELHEADLLIHLVDASNPSFPDQILAVEEILADLALDNLPILLVLNKKDRLAPEELEAITRTWEGPAISALDPATLGPLLTALEERLAEIESAEAAGPAPSKQPLEGLSARSPS
jgi:GTP-binding protein HflX